MGLSVVMFFVGAGLVLAGYASITYLPAMLAQRAMDRRLRDVSKPVVVELPGGETSLVMKTAEGPLPGVDRLMARTNAGSKLARLIEQSGVKTSPSAIVVLTLALAGAAGLVTMWLSRAALAPVTAVIAGCLPVAYLMNRRSSRMRVFEEQFPEALDLMSRALRAGHAFQTSLGMAADDMRPPVGPEFKKTFDQQNYGLPLRDALMQMADRVPLLDVRFFVTAVLIQRETGGNLAEILDNLAHVVRERFKIRRQVRVHTAHGRFTAFVLLALPAALGVALMFINPEHMDVLFKTRIGQMLLAAACVMQLTGFVWIRQVIKIEV
jgi:tight adherence protein B